MSTKNLLIVEDDISLGETLKERLQKEGYAVSKAESMAEALLQARANTYDLFILDVGLPDGSGFDLAKQIRQFSPSPFIFVTAQSNAEARLEGYEIGAEEYIPKPFHLKELLMRVQHVLENHAQIHPLTLADRTIDFAAHQIIYSNGDKEPIPAKDIFLLQLLISRSPQVVSRDDILNSVWGEDKFPSTRTVDNTILRLRQFLGPAGQAIRSVRGVGYQWDTTNE